jgi:Tannase and feruloyl esterase
VVPGESVQDYRAVASRYAGKNLDEFYRLFLVPGMAHCSGGAGPDHFDALSAMVEWVEKSRAPDQLMASQFAGAQAAGSPLRTRPLCPYPQVAHYHGNGSIDEAANFSCVAPGP